MAVLTLEEQVLRLPKEERKQFLIDKIKYYRSGPEGCLAYIDEVIRYPNSAGGYSPLEMWPIQRRMVWELIDFLFDMDRQFYTILGSRQCAKTYSMNIIIDYLLTLYSNYPAVLLHADAGRASKNILEYKDIANNKCPIMRYDTKINRSMMIVYKNLSKFMGIPTQKSSKQADTGRSLTSNLLWVDEAAFIDLEKLESSVWPVTSQAFLQCRKNHIPFGIILTSSANGRLGIGKRFYEYWKMAEENLSDGIVSRGTISGFRLHYSMVPGKDEKWKKDLLSIMTERNFNQEYECVFYGGESTFFNDTTIKAIQDRSIKLTTDHIETSSVTNYVISTGSMYTINQYKPIESGSSYIVGIDVSKGSGMDSHVLQVLNFDTMEQIIEVKDSKTSQQEFAEVVHHVSKDIILANNGRLIIGIENNMGFALISELFKLDDMYKVLIYKDTLAEDYKAKKDTVKVEYGKCKYGIATTALTRPFIIDLIYRFVNNNVDLINSIYLLNEVESLELKDGKIQGAVHDDSVFALGMVLLIKNKGRISNIMSIFEACEDFWTNKNSNTPKAHATLVADELFEEANPLVGVDMRMGLSYAAGMRIPTGTVISGSGHTFSTESAYQISQMYNKQLQDNNSVLATGVIDKPKAVSKLGKHLTMKETYEDMPRSDVDYSKMDLEKRAASNWGKFVAFDD